MPAIRHTPLFHAHQRAAANLTGHHGWQVPAWFTEPAKEAVQLSNSVAVSDLSWITKLDLKGCDVNPTIPAWYLSRGHYLVTCEPPKREAVLANLPPAYVTDITSVYAQFLVAGPRSRNVLRKLTSLNVTALENAGCGQASVAHVHGIVLRDDLKGLPAFNILVSRESGESVWEAILYAGHEFHITPCGFRALEMVGATA